jgi:putative salt-induced outer membrane protein YdiY
MKIIIALSLAALAAAPALAADAPPAPPTSAPNASAAPAATSDSASSAVLAPVAIVAPAPPPQKKWKDSAEASFVNTNGNSKTTTTAGKDAFEYDFNKRTELAVEGGGLGTRSAGQVTAEQYYAGEKLQRRFDDRDYVFENYRWDKNRFAGYLSLQVISVGLGRYLLKSKADVLTFEASPGYLNEQFIAAPRRSVGTARAYSKYEHDFTATSKFSQDVEYIQSLADKRDSRINTETDLTTALSAHFSVKTSFIWKRANLPAAGIHKDDEITSFALIATF